MTTKLAPNKLKRSLSYGIDISRDDCFVLSQSTRLTDEETDRQKVDCKSAP